MSIDITEILVTSGAVAGVLGYLVARFRSSTREALDNLQTTVLALYKEIERGLRSLLADTERELDAERQARQREQTECAKALQVLAARINRLEQGRP